MFGHVIQQSTARKVTGLPVINTAYQTCPLTCPLNPNNPEPDTGGCYAAQGYGGGIEATTRKHGREYTMDEVVDIVRKNPAPWIRDRQVGDLVDDEIPSWNHALFVNDVAKRTRKTAFGYTSTWKELTRIELSNYVMNASCLSEQDVSEAIDSGWDATLVADDKTDGELVDGQPGYRYFHCPADVNGLACHQCGMCMRSNRKQVVVFKPHGSGRNLVRKVLARQSTSK